jgi:hypothetical protein
MKFPKHLIVCMLFPLLTAQTCMKDSDEKYDERIDCTGLHFEKKEHVTKAMAVEDWELFLKQSQEAIDIAETNIGNLEIKIDEADAAQKIEWQETCDYSNRMLIKLKVARTKRNNEFNNEIKAYDRAVYDRNEVFETQFDSDMALITTKLASLFQKVFSGYYKTNI